MVLSVVPRIPCRQRGCHSTKRSGEDDALSDSHCIKYNYSVKYEERLD
jgi:hypothetical protein